MVANPKSLSTQANLTTPPPVPTPDQTENIDVAFTLSGSGASFTFSAISPGSDNVTLYNFNLTSAPEGWQLSGVNIGPSGGSPWFSSPPTSYYMQAGEAEFWVTVASNSIAVTVQDENNSGSDETVCVTLAVSNPNANPSSYTSQDPQIILVPR
jgi:hypothetical protein